MKEIDSYIEEKLTLNKQSKIVFPFKIDIIGNSNFTKNEIDEIANFFQTSKVTPYKITSYYNIYRSNSTKIIYAHFKSIYSKDDNDICDSIISIEKNIDNFTISVYAHVDDTGLHIGCQLYPYGGSYVSLDDLIEKWLPKAILDKGLLESL